MQEHIKFDNQGFIERIQDRLEQLDLSQNQLAQMIGISRSTVTGWIRHGKLPDAETLAKLCMVLECTSDWLLGLERQKGRVDASGKIRWRQAIPNFISGFQRDHIAQGIELFNRLVGNEEAPSNTITNYNLQYLQFAIQAAFRSGALRLTHVERATESEERIKQKYPFLKAVVVADIPSQYDGTIIRAEMVSFLAMRDILSQVVREDMVGLGVGYTLLRMCEMSIPSVDQFKGTHWLPLITFTDDNDSGYTANALAKLMQLRHPGSKAMYLPHPATLTEDSTAYRLFEETSRMMKNVQTLFVTVNGVGRRDRTVNAHPLTDFRTADYTYDSIYLRDLVEDLPDSEVLGGEILSYLLNTEGQVISWDKNRVWQINLDVLRYNTDLIGKVCIVAARTYKAKAVETCIRNGLANMLVIDNEIADYLLRF